MKVEAKTIRTLFDLYEQFGTVRLVKESADKMQLRTRQRETTAGKQTGGGPFDRGHIHHILTNPIYAGKIRHRKEVHEGQHEAIIDPGRWDRIQTQFQAGARKGRAHNAAKQTSLLCGKLFDETGDRLTPSHSKTKAGVRLQYYVSHRLIKNSGDVNKDGWRLPAEELEKKVAYVLHRHLNAPAFISTVLQKATASELAVAKEKVQQICACKGVKPSLRLIERIDLKAGELRVALKAAALGGLLECDPAELEQAALTIIAPFQLRKRGVETKLIFADDPAGRDEVLIRNIAKAHQWYEQIKAGKTLTEIAKIENTTNGRIYHLIDMAFLAPDIIRDVLYGKQPIGFTSDWFIRHEMPSDWTAQRQLLATL